MGALKSFWALALERSAAAFAVVRIEKYLTVLRADVVALSIECRGS